MIKHRSKNYQTNKKKKKKKKNHANAQRNTLFYHYHYVLRQKQNGPLEARQKSSISSRSAIHGSTTPVNLENAVTSSFPNFILLKLAPRALFRWPAHAITYLYNTHTFPIHTQLKPKSPKARADWPHWYTDTYESNFPTAVAMDQWN